MTITEDNGMCAINSVEQNCNVSVNCLSVNIIGGHTDGQYDLMTRYLHIFLWHKGHLRNIWLWGF
jgi:hypothetical protein